MQDIKTVMIGLGNTGSLKSSAFQSLEIPYANGNIKSY